MCFTESHLERTYLRVSTLMLESKTTIYDSQNLNRFRCCSGITSRIPMSATPQKKSPFLSRTPVKAAVLSPLLTQSDSMEIPTLDRELATNYCLSSSPTAEMNVKSSPRPKRPRHSAVFLVLPPSFIEIVPTCELAEPFTIELD